MSPLNRDVFDETDFAPAAAVSVPVVVVPNADQPAVAELEPEQPAVSVTAPEPGGPAEAGLRSPDSIRPLPRLQTSWRKLPGKEDSPE